MKQYSFFLMSFMAIIMMSCTNKAKKLNGEAKEAVKQVFLEIAKDPSSVQLSNVNTVFSNDSLCILHLDLKAKNGLGIESNSKMEYVYMVSGEEKYEAYQALESDSVYQDIETFERTKKDKMYAELPYENALYYRAAILANSSGRSVGDKAGEKEVNIPMPTGTGFWEVSTYKDEFGEDTSERYLRIGGKGYFSNSATTGSRMTAYLFVDRKSFGFRFIEYDSHVVKDDETCHMKIKDSYGDVHEFTLYNSNSGQMTSYSDYEIKEILKKGGKITVSAEMGKYTKSQYLFKMDVTGYDKAYEFISPINDPIVKENKLENENYLKENAKKEGIISLPSGLQYKVIKEGDGIIPSESSKVTVNYEGRLIDGTIFDSSYKRGNPIEIRPNQAIKGWCEALTHMPAGSTWEIYIPQNLAYGDREQGEIKPFSTLIFVVELLKVTDY